MACKHDQRTAYVQKPRPKRGIEAVGLVCVKCARFWESGSYPFGTEAGRDD